MRTYKPTLTLRLLIALFLLLPGAILLIVAATGSSPAVTASIGTPLLVIGVLLWWVAGRASITVDDQGVTRKGYFGGVVAMRFDEVSEYRYSSTTVNGVDTVNLALQARDGRVIKITSNWRDVFDAAKQLIEGAETHGLKDQRAGLAATRVAFGPFTIEDGAVSGKGKRVPFAEIKAVELAGPSLRVTQHGKLLSAFSFPSAKVPNVFLLLDELRARGVSAPDSRPWRAVVSVAGYQVPKR
jgi:hypothetical protein